MQGLARFLWWLTRRRVRAYWRLLLVSFVAVLLGTTIVSATALYANTLAERGLQHTLSSAPRDTLNAQLVIQERPMGETEYRKLQVSVERAVIERMGDRLTEQHRYGRTVTSRLLETSAQRPGLQGYAFFLSGFEEHAALVKGRWPRTPLAAQEDSRRPLEIAIGQDLARRLRWDVGLELAMWPTGLERSDAVLLTVVGVMAPKNPSEEYWLGQLELFRLIETDEGVFIPLFIREQDFFSGIGARYPAMPGDFWWRLFLDSRGLSSGMVRPVINALSALETDVNKLFPRSLLLTSLDAQLEEYQKRLGLAQVPIYLFSALVVGVLLYYLWMVSSMLARARGPEVALLRSRGASLLQTVLLVGVSEGLLVAGPAVVLGPVLALLLVRFPLGSSLFQGNVAGALPSISAGVYGLSALVGLLAVSVLSLASLGAGRGSVVDQLRERSRPPATSALHRYYLDLFLLVVMGFAWWQLRNRGGFITARLLGEGVEVSPFTLVGPALGLFAAALLMLRLFPLLMRLLARAAEAFGSPWVLHGMRRVARNANLYGALCLLLTLAIALGIFGAVFSATLHDARRAQALYQVGGEVVVKVPFALSDAQLAASQAALADVAEVTAASPLLRAQGSLVKGGAAMPMSVLAVDPETFPQTAWFRRDFSSRSLEGLMDDLRQPSTPEAGVPLPAEAAGVGVWARPSKSFKGLNLWAHLTDARGQTRSVFVGELDVAEWRSLSGALPRDDNLSKPFRVLGFFLTTGLRGSIGAGELYLDDLGITDASGATRSVEGFDRPGAWLTLPHRGATGDAVRQVGAPRARSGGALEFAWTVPLGQDVRGIMLPTVPTPLPVIAGPPFNEGETLVVAVERVLVPVRVVGTASHFPTLDPHRGSFLVLNLEHYLRHTSVVPFGSPGLPNEVWLATDPPALRPQALAKLRDALPPFASVTNRAEEVALAERDPLTAGGWRSLVLLGLVALVGTAVLGFILFAAISVQTGQVELAVLEAIGFSRANIFLLVALEFVMIGAVGILAGVGIGLWVGRWALGYLTAQGLTQASLPPVALGMDSGLSAVTLVGAVAAAGLAALFALLIVWRMSPSAVLREEA